MVFNFCVCEQSTIIFVSGLLVIVYSVHKLGGRKAFKTRPKQFNLNADNLGLNHGNLKTATQRYSGPDWRLFFKASGHQDCFLMTEGGGGGSCNPPPIKTYTKSITVCPRSLASYYIKWLKTSWTYSIYM